jgi:hypothetical protein
MSVGGGALGQPFPPNHDTEEVGERDLLLVRRHFLGVPDFATVLEHDGNELTSGQLRRQDHPSLAEARVAKRQDGVV